MRHTIRAGLLLLVLVPLLGACAGVPDPISSDIDRAVALAVTAMEAEPAGGEVVVTEARQLIWKGKYVWRVVFKLAHLLPEDPAGDFVGLGGETFATVDLGAGTVVLRPGD